MAMDFYLRKILDKKPEERTRADVEFLRTEGVSLGGCCNRFADNQGCDCMERAKDASMTTPRIRKATTAEVPIQIGTVVTLKSGGPRMTIEGYERPATTGMAVCSWFTPNGELKSASFKAEALEVAK